MKVDNVPTGTTDGFPKMLVAFPAGVGTPTVAIFYEPLMETFIGPGYLEPAIPEALCATSQQEIIDRYIPGSIDPLLRDGNRECPAGPAQRVQPAGQQRQVHRGGAQAPRRHPDDVG